MTHLLRFKEVAARKLGHRSWQYTYWGSEAFFPGSFSTCSFYRGVSLSSFIPGKLPFATWALLPNHILISAAPEPVPSSGKTGHRQSPLTLHHHSHLHVTVFDLFTAAFPHHLGFGILVGRTLPWISGWAARLLFLLFLQKRIPSFKYFLISLGCNGFGMGLGWKYLKFKVL